MDALNIFQIGAEISRVVGLVHEENTRHKVRDERRWLHSVSGRHQHVQVHRTKISTHFLGNCKNIPSLDCTHEIPTCLHSSIVGDKAPEFHTV